MSLTYIYDIEVITKSAAALKHTSSSSSSFWNRTLKTFIAHSGRRPYMEDSCVTVKAALQSSLKYKTEKERKIADIHKKWAVSFPFAVFTFSVVRKKKKTYLQKKQQKRTT